MRGWHRRPGGRQWTDLLACPLLACSKIGKKLRNKFRERKPLPERTDWCYSSPQHQNRISPTAPWTTCKRRVVASSGCISQLGCRHIGCIMSGGSALSALATTMLHALDHHIMRVPPSARLSHIAVILHSQPQFSTKIARLVCYQRGGVNNHVLSGGARRKTSFLIRNDSSSLVLQRGPILKSHSPHKTKELSTYSSN